MYGSRLSGICLRLEISRERERERERINVSSSPVVMSLVCLRPLIVSINPVSFYNVRRRNRTTFFWDRIGSKNVQGWGTLI